MNYYKITIVVGKTHPVLLETYQYLNGSTDAVRGDIENEIYRGGIWIQIAGACVKKDEIMGFSVTSQDQALKD